MHGFILATAKIFDNQISREYILTNVKIFDNLIVSQYNI